MKVTWRTLDRIADCDTVITEYPTAKEVEELRSRAFWNNDSAVIKLLRYSRSLRVAENDRERTLINRINDTIIQCRKEYERKGMYGD